LEAIVSDAEIPDEPVHPEHVSGALMLSFGAVHIGREALAVAMFTEVSRHLGALLADDAITGFSPFFFADGQLNGISGFFLVEGHREALDAVRRDPAFQKLILRTSAATANVGVHTLVAGTEAGRLVNLYRSVRGELGLL
jgi:hypothetical protein